jgi:cysteine desulfurase
VIYLDNSSATVVCQSAIDKMVEYSKKHFTSPLSPNKIGLDINYKLEDAYQLIYDFLGSSYEDTFLFSSSGAEAIFHVLFGIYYEIIRTTGKTHLVTIKTEDAPILLTLQKLKDLGCVVHTVDVNENGLVDLDHLKKLINPKVALVSLSWANGLTGVVQPINEIADICEESNILLHVDASHVLGKLYLPLNDILIHYLTFSGELIHAPKSSGGLVMKKGYELSPLISGESQGKYQKASLDVAALMAFSAACKQSLLSIDTMTLEIAALRAEFEKNIKDKVEKVTIFYENYPRLPNISCMAFEKVHSEALLYYLNQQNVYATFGGNRAQHLSNLIKGDKGMSAISFALSRYTTKEMIVKASNIIIDVVKFLQSISADL